LKTKKNLQIRGFALVFIALLLATGCGDTKTVTQTVTVDEGAKPGVGAPLDLVEFGYIKSLTRKGSGYQLRFDPAWHLVGETANVAAAEDGAIPPGEPVPNDSYVVDEGHRLLTYKVPPNARVTVLKDSPQGKPATVEQLAQLVAGKNPFSEELFEPLKTGFWIRVHIDTVRSLDQQYHP
jgi:hypothetical protein